MKCMEIGIIVALLAILLAVWLISVQRRLVVLDENIKNAMSQIGVQLSSWYDATLALLELAEAYDAAMGEKADRLRAECGMVTAESDPAQAAGQEQLLSEIRQVLQAIAEQYPKVQEEPGYRKYLNAAESYEKMLHTSGLIYNDTVSKYNGTIRLFSVNVAARLLHFHKKAYLEMG